MQLLAMKGVASAIIGTGSKFMSLPSAHAHGSNMYRQDTVCINYVTTHVYTVNR